MVHSYGGKRFVRPELLNPVPEQDFNSYRAYFEDIFASSEDKTGHDLERFHIRQLSKSTSMAESPTSNPTRLRVCSNLDVSEKVSHQSLQASFHLRKVCMSKYPSWILVRVNHEFIRKRRDVFLLKCIVLDLEEGVF